MTDLSYCEYLTSEAIFVDHPTAKWTREGDIPKLGDEVQACVNNIGQVAITGYFHEHGFVGVKALPLNPPDWYVKQNGAQTECHLFGAEIK